MDEVLGLNDTLLFNGNNGQGKVEKVWAIETNCDSILMKSRRVGSWEHSWSFLYRILENGKRYYFNRYMKLNHPTNTGNIEVDLYYIDGLTDTDYLELRTVLFAICIKTTKLNKSYFMLTVFSLVKLI